MRYEESKDEFYLLYILPGFAEDKETFFTFPLMHMKQLGIGKPH